MFPLLLTESERQPSPSLFRTMLFQIRAIKEPKKKEGTARSSLCPPAFRRPWGRTALKHSQQATKHLHDRAYTAEMALRKALPLATFKSLRPGGTLHAGVQPDWCQSMRLVTFKDYINQSLMGRSIGSQNILLLERFLITGLLVRHDRATAKPDPAQLANRSRWMHKRLLGGHQSIGLERRVRKRRSHRSSGALDLSSGPQIWSFSLSQNNDTPPQKKWLQLFPYVFLCFNVKWDSAGGKWTHHIL